MLLKECDKKEYYWKVYYYCVCISILLLPSLIALSITVKLAKSKSQVSRPSISGSRPVYIRFKTSLNVCTCVLILQVYLCSSDVTLGEAIVPLVKLTDTATASTTNSSISHDTPRSIDGMFPLSGGKGHPTATTDAYVGVSIVLRKEGQAFNPDISPVRQQKVRLIFLPFLVKFSMMLSATHLGVRLFCTEPSAIIDHSKSKNYSSCVTFHLEISFL